MSTITAIVVVALTVLMVYAGTGWLTILFLPASLIAGVVHVAVRSLPRRNAAPDDRRLDWVADAAFFLSFAIQVNEGDGPKFLIIESVIPDTLRHGWLPYWWPGPLHLIAFAAPVYCWFRLARRSRGPR